MREMRRIKKLRGLFVSGDGISIRRLREAPPLLVGLAHPGFMRTAVDCGRGVAFYEEEAPLLLVNLAAAYRNRMEERMQPLPMTVHKRK
jgi:hypothetical protein